MSGSTCTRASCRRQPSTAARLFTEATSENAVAALAEAIGRFDTPAAVLSDNGRCLDGGRSKKRLPKGS